MKIAYIQHVAYEDLGVIDVWAQERGFTLTAYKPFLGDALPAMHEFDWLIILGGPQSALDVDKIDYLQREVDFIQKAFIAEKPILGICLGAQLMGVARGGCAARSPEKEMGCFPIELTQDAKHDPIFNSFPEQFESLHWHSDMIGLPDDAVVLAKSAGCPHQVVRFAKNAYGLQCHLEFNQPRMQKLIDKAYHELTPSTYLQSKEQILQTNFSAVNQMMLQFLEKFIQI